MRRLLLSLLALSLLLLGVAAPASAAAVITSFTVNGSTGTVTVDPDASLSVAWATTGDAELDVTASGTGWSGSLDDSGTQTVAGPSAGETLTFTLNANDGDDVPTSETITVTAEDDEPAGSTPPPVVVADCIVTVPSSDDFAYELVYDGDEDFTDPIDAGTYTIAELTEDGFFEVTIVAVPQDGVVVADGATTEWDVPFSEECSGPDLIDVAAGTCSFDVENVTDGPLEILYGNPESNRADGEFTLAAGASRTVRTNREFLIVAAVVDLEDPEADFEIEPVELSQRGCNGGSDGTAGSGPRWPVPVNAPAAGVSAAGVDAGSGTAPWLLAGLLVALGLAGGAARTRASS